jgi:hypothetical protein
MKGCGERGLVVVIVRAYSGGCDVGGLVVESRACSGKGM